MTTYFISPDGDDANSGLVVDCPKRTFANVLPLLGKNDVLYLFPGEYTPITTSISYSNNNGIAS